MSVSVSGHSMQGIGRLSSTGDQQRRISAANIVRVCNLPPGAQAARAPVNWQRLPRSETLSGDGSLTIQLPLEIDIDSYFVIKVKQEADDDPASRCHKDDAWLAPIFIEWSSDDGDVAEGGDSDGVQFVGSKNSKLYHLPTCSVVGNIKPANLREYATAPDGKTLHVGCPW